MKYLIASILLMVGVVASHAEIYSFYAITANDSNGVAQTIGESQLFMDVTIAGSGLANFAFTNTGSSASTITEIYFDAPDATPALDLGLAGIINGTGVQFYEGKMGKTTPSNLPGGENLIDPFVSDIGAEAEPAPVYKGVDPYEYVLLEMSYNNSYNLLDMLKNEELRIGLHVIGMGTGSYSESFINNNFTSNIPEPASLILFGATAAVVAFVRRRFAV
ncbi:MAG: PEP-CTERM sorting domain-containing protein [Verrucomicrobia bacterium]|nr:PEP-CTERM sorting domain-containing protein [Verrucomicrobiota bacterium]